MRLELSRLPRSAMDYQLDKRYGELELNAFFSETTPYHGTVKLQEAYVVTSYTT